MPKFDFIIQNPPYTTSKNKALYVDFFNKGYDLLTNTGKMVIISPSLWLIDILSQLNNNPSKQQKLYLQLKQHITDHVVKIIIDNYNKEFCTSLKCPFSITFVDKAQCYSTIHANIFGYKCVVSHLNDVNLVGYSNLIKSIFNKLKKVDNIAQHSYQHISDIENMYFCKTASIGRSICADPRTSDVWYRNNLFAYYYWNSFDDRPPVDIDSFPLKKLKNGYTYSKPQYTNDIDKKINIVGTKIELENYKYNCYHTTIIPFINIVLTINSGNLSLEYSPWLVDKKYTNQEIYNLFDFTNEEIKLIETTIKRYDSTQAWFKRYMHGFGASTDEDVQKFINELENA